MVVYDDVSNFCNLSPTSTVSTSSSSSSSSSSSGMVSPVYENVEELTGLCSRSWKMIGKRSSKPSMSDFLAQIPPPPPVFEEDHRFGPGFMKRCAEPSPTSSSSSSSTSSSSASSRRPIMPAAVLAPVSASFSPSPLPLPPSASSSASSSSVHRCFDMRPLSLPHKEMQRIEREQSHRVLIITLLIITIFIVLIALSIYIFFDEIENHINNIADSF
ncbi:unnamed protein product [Caenorhabditis sp. 36 PRJEB53466]|nr:unnamed protein product [Caenorhabditis sp. 36 PRJEB53466]